jgi:hypothetical protein
MDMSVTLKKDVTPTKDTFSYVRLWDGQKKFYRRLGCTSLPIKIALARECFYSVRACFRKAQMRYTKTPLFKIVLVLDCSDSRISTLFWNEGRLRCVSSETGRNQMSLIPWDS